MKPTISKLSAAAIEEFVIKIVQPPEDDPSSEENFYSSYVDVPPPSSPDPSPPGPIEAGDTEGQMAYWDGTNDIWTYTDVTELFWDDTNKILQSRSHHPLLDEAYDLGEITTPLRWRNGYFSSGDNVNGELRHESSYSNKNEIGTIGVLDAGLTAYLQFSLTLPTGIVTFQDRAAATDYLYVQISDTLTGMIQDSAASYSWLEVNEVGSGSLIYNTVNNQLFHQRSYWQLNGAGWVAKHDILWSGVTRNNFCGIGTVSSPGPGSPDLWFSGMFIDNLPDTLYAAVATGYSKTPILTPDVSIPTVTVYATPHHTVGPSHLVGSVTGRVSYTVVETTTNMGIDAFLMGGGPLNWPTCCFDSWAAMAAFIGFYPPDDTISGAGMDKCDWMLRRYY